MTDCTTVKMTHTRVPVPLKPCDVKLRVACKQTSQTFNVIFDPTKVYFALHCVGEDCVVSSASSVNRLVA